MGILGALCLLFSALMTVFSHFAVSPAVKARELKLATYYVAAAALLLALRWTMSRLQQWVIHRRSRRRADTADTSRDGAVLILTLVVVALLAGLILHAQVTARMSLRASQSMLLKERLRVAAADACRTALRDLACEPGQITIPTNSAWWSSFEWEDPSGISTKVVVADENRYFDLNNLALPPPDGGRRSAADITADLLTLCGDFTPLAKVDALVDWMDKDEEGRFEQAFYAERAPPYAPPNRPLHDWQEMLFAGEMSRASFAPHAMRGGPGHHFQEDLGDCVTVLPLPRIAPVPVNLNTASRPVLLGVFGLGQDELVDSVVAMRAIRPLESLDAVVALMEPGDAAALTPYLDVRSHCFRVQARSYAQGQTQTLWVQARRARTGEVEILRWVYL